MKQLIETADNKSLAVPVRGTALRLIGEKAERDKNDASLFDALVRALEDKDLRASAASHLTGRIKGAKVLKLLQEALAKEQAAEKPNTKYIEQLTAFIKELTPKGK